MSGRFLHWGIGGRYDMQSIWSCWRRIGFRAAPFLRSCRGTLMSLPEGAALSHKSQPTYPAKPAKSWKGDSPPPLPIRYAGIAHPSLALYGTGTECFTSGRREGVLRSDIRVPEAKRGRVPCRNKEEHHPSANQETKKLNTKALILRNQGFICARYWDRTSDLFRVREARYRCANRARGVRCHRILE